MSEINVETKDSKMVAGIAIGSRFGVTLVLSLGVICWSGAAEEEDGVTVGTADNFEVGALA